MLYKAVGMASDGYDRIVIRAEVPCTAATADLAVKISNDHSVALRQLHWLIQSLKALSLSYGQSFKDVVYWQRLATGVKDF